MYTHFIFNDGSNPYITTTNTSLFKMISKYYIEQTSEQGFNIIGKLQLLTIKPEKLSQYKRNQCILRNFAQQWQYDFHNFNYSYGELLNWQNFFEEMGKKYGLMREFRENGIC